MSYRKLSRTSCRTSIVLGLWPKCVCIIGVSRMLNLRRLRLTGQHQRLSWIAQWRNQKWINKLNTWALARCPQPVNSSNGQREKGERPFSVVNSALELCLEWTAIMPLPCVGVRLLLWRPCALVKEGEAMNGGTAPPTLRPGCGRGMHLYSVCVDCRTYHFEQWQNWVQNRCPYMRWALICLLTANRTCMHSYCGLCQYIMPAAVCSVCVHREPVGGEVCACPIKLIQKYVPPRIARTQDVICTRVV